HSFVLLDPAFHACPTDDPRVIPRLHRHVHVPANIFQEPAHRPPATVHPLDDCSSAALHAGLRLLTWSVRERAAVAIEPAIHAPPITPASAPPVVPPPHRLCSRLRTGRDSHAHHGR